MTEKHSVPVLIVGAGPVGLALAGDLGWRGVHCLVVEQSDGAIYQPKMDGVGVRTMEFCRRWGIAKDVEASPYPRDYPQDNVYVTGMNGYELGRERFPALGADRPSPFSPQKRERCPQNMFDPILQKFAASQRCVEIRYRARLRSFSQNDSFVVAEIEDLNSGRISTIEARFIAGCDGAHSLVRETLGIGMRGQPALTYTTNVIFRCSNFNSLHDKERAYRQIFIGPEGTWATIVAINGLDQWRMSIVGNDERRELSVEEIREAIRRAVGVDFEFEILTVVPWVRRELVADRFVDGRSIVLGDAAHVMSPTGGFGMNTGIADAIDLSWKLEALLAGWGGRDLLQSFESERRPIALRNVAEATNNLRRMLSPGKNPQLLDSSEEGARLRERLGRDFTAAMRHEWFVMGVHLGYRYEDSPICWPDGTEPTPDHPNTYVPTSRPGSRAPHVWLDDGRSTLDLFGRGFTLLRLGKDASDAAPIIAAAVERGVPMSSIDVTQPSVDEAYRTALVLVRPDGHVAWRGDRLPADPLRLIDCIRGERCFAWRSVAQAIDGPAAITQ